MSVNMFGLAFFTEAHARSKKGHPPHSTTGVASTNCIQSDRVEALPCGQEGKIALKSTNISDIASTNTGIVRIADMRNRRFMSMNSGSGLSSSVISFGSRAIPQIGHEPGPI